MNEWWTGAAAAAWRTGLWDLLERLWEFLVLVFHFLLWLLRFLGGGGGTAAIRKARFQQEYTRPRVLARLISRLLIQPPRRRASHAHP
ncbi:hypothetical protein [Burkholderia gladioli]|nr:hypothetical protein [Burkholderia gladioli]